MVNTAVKVSASPNHLTYILTGDGTVAGPIITQALLMADMVEGPLKRAWSQVLTTQAAMRAKLLGGDGAGTAPNSGFCEAEIQLMATGTDTTGQVTQVVADVDTDAVSTTKAEINIGMGDTAGQIAMLHLRHRHTIVQ